MLQRRHPNICRLFETFESETQVGRLIRDCGKGWRHGVSWCTGRHSLTFTSLHISSYLHIYLYLTMFFVENWGLYGVGTLPWPTLRQPCCEGGWRVCRVQARSTAEPLEAITSSVKPLQITAVLAPAGACGQCLSRAPWRVRVSSCVCPPFFPEFVACKLWNPIGSLLSQVACLHDRKICHRDRGTWVATQRNWDQVL